MPASNPSLAVHLPPRLYPPAFRNRNSPRRRTGLPCVRDRFDAVEIPLKRTRKSQKARRIPFLSPISIMGKDLAAKPQSRNAIRFIGSAICAAGFRMIQFACRMDLPRGVLLGRGLLCRPRLLRRAGDAKAHQQESKPLAQSAEQAHWSNPFHLQADGGLFCMVQTTACPNSSFPMSSTRQALAQQG